MANENPNVQILPVQTMPAPQGGMMTPGFIQQAQDPADFIENLKLAWSAKEWVPDPANPGQSILKETGTPIMNKTGVSALSGIVRGIISKHIMNSAYGMKSVNDRVYLFGEELSKEMRYNYVRWGLDLHSSGQVFWQIVLQVDGIYRQALDVKGVGMGMWPTAMISTYNEQKIIDNTYAQQKPGVLSSLPFAPRRT